MISGRRLWLCTACMISLGSCADETLEVARANACQALAETSAARDAIEELRSEVEDLTMRVEYVEAEVL